jgi:hypothetical protein
MSFFTPNIVVSNPIPDEIKIFYSKDTAVVNIVFLIIFMGLGVFLLTAGNYLIGAMICLVAVCLICAKMKGLFTNKRQVTINKLGIETATAPFYNWSEITEERVSGEYAGRGARPLLEYKHPGGKVSIKVEPLNIRPQDLNVLLKYYRTPWEFRSN